MIVRNNRIMLMAFLAMVMGFVATTFTSCTDLAADDDDSAATDDDDSAAVDDDDSAE